MQVLWGVAKYGERGEGLGILMTYTSDIAFEEVTEIHVVWACAIAQVFSLPHLQYVPHFVL